jgi:hypothetical protein
VKTIASQIEISAPPEHVWDVLADFDSYSEWNPFMDKVSGQALRGAWMRISMRSPRGRRLHFRARVLAARRPSVLAWEGRGWAWWPGLLHGERRICIEALPKGRSRVEMRTTFTGLLSSSMRWLNRYRSSFEEMELALKQRAEGSR